MAKKKTSKKQMKHKCSTEELRGIIEGYYAELREAEEYLEKMEALSGTTDPIDIRGVWSLHKVKEFLRGTTNGFRRTVFELKDNA